jgi:beta-glucosidase
LFAFGHGLSYTTFSYANPQVPASVASGSSFEVTVEVRNTGKRVGQETVQLYVGDEATTDVVRPIKELKAFQKINLAPGESKTVKFTVTPRDLCYYDVHKKDWTSTPGAHRIYLGSSSADIRVSQAFQWTAPRDPRTPRPEQPSLADFF